MKHVLAKTVPGAVAAAVAAVMKAAAAVDGVAAEAVAVAVADTATVEIVESAAVATAINLGTAEQFNFEKAMLARASPFVYFT